VNAGGGSIDHRRRYPFCMPISGHFLFVQKRTQALKKVASKNLPILTVPPELMAAFEQDCCYFVLSFGKSNVCVDFSWV
jgi:hypothetical protein